LIGGAIALAYGGYCYHFPYGSSHCCDLILHQALADYAAKHNGAFPDGQATPEASLSLLYPKYADACLLKGKAVRESAARAILERGELLGPESCSWHYVPGLNVYDNPQLALFWDKAGLNHNGGRMSCGGHTVLFVGGERRHIPGPEWDAFLEEQRKLLAERDTPAELRVDATGELQGKPVHAQLRVMHDSLYGRIWLNGQMASGMSIARIDKRSNLGVGGLPVVTRAELRAAKAVVDEHAIRFVLPQHEIVCDGQHFHFK
jgi:hypothetical protein